MTVTDIADIKIILKNGTKKQTMKHEKYPDRHGRAIKV
jgi:hypothetical protein